MIALPHFLSADGKVILYDFVRLIKPKCRREIYRQAISRLLRGLPSSHTGGKTAVCLDVGDGATCSFLAAGEGSGAVVSYEPAEWSHLLVGQVRFITSPQLQHGMIFSRGFVSHRFGKKRGCTIGGHGTLGYSLVEREKRVYLFM